MVVSDPAAELLELVRAGGDPAPCRPDPADMARALLIRRRFGLSLPPPFVELDGDPPIRRAAVTDAAAIAAIKWRSFGTDYRGVFPDRFLDDRAVVPPVSYWIDRVAAPAPEGLLVWGRPGSVFGYLEHGRSETDPDGGAIFELYVDPCAQGRGGGAALLRRAIDDLGSRGCSAIEVWAAVGNGRAHRFYQRHGFRETGERDEVDLGTDVIEEIRFIRSP